MVVVYQYDGAHIQNTVNKEADIELGRRIIVPHGNVCKVRIPFLENMPVLN